MSEQHRGPKDRATGERIRNMGTAATEAEKLKRSGGGRLPTHTTSRMWKFAAFKIACCGTPLLILLVASGAIAVVDLALGAAAVALAVAAWLLWRWRRRACACEVPQQQQRREATPTDARTADRGASKNGHGSRDPVLSGRRR
jgi:Flp pilus assembly protein TadB